jgi:hypothetical protein
MDYAEAFLRDQVPPVLQSLVPTTLRMAYQAARQLVSSESILNVPSAQDNWGRITQWAVDFSFERLCESSQWPFDFRWRPFERPTGRYLEIRPSHSVITISQVADPTGQPRDVLFRENKRLCGQGWLRGLPRPDDDKPLGGEPHIILIHGHRELNFAHLGIPKGEHDRGYHYRTPNLMLMPHLVTTPEPPPENTDIEAIVTLKDQKDRWRKDNAE